MKKLVLLLCCTFPGLVLAQQAPPYSCEATPEHRQFDFWVGKWEVTDKTGETRYGWNTISSRNAGCLLYEEWRNLRDITGSSMNYYNPSDKQWHQHWVDSGSTIIHTAGGLVEGSMVMEGTIYYLANGRKAKFRGKWTPLPDGQVRQFFEEQNDEGQWQPWFEGFYRPVE